MFNIQKIDNRVIVETCYYGINGLYFKFMGKLTDKDIDLDKVCSILDKVFSKDVIYGVDDIDKVIKYIRTICCCFEEEDLFVNIRDKVCERVVSFNNGNLVKSISYGVIGNINIEFLYDVNSHKNFVIKTGNYQGGYCYGNELIDFVSREVKFLDNLRNIDKITLMDNHKKLCKFYQMFYNEIPDFNDNITRMKAQIMMTLLDEYDVLIDDMCYCFRDIKRSEFVMSVKFKKLLDELRVFGSMNDSFNDIELSTHINKVIFIVRDEISKYLNNNMNDLDSLISIIEIRDSDVNMVDKTNLKLEPKLRVLNKIYDRVSDRDK